MENVINLHKRTIKNVETLCEFTFAMQFAALEVAARVVVCRALGAECKGENDGRTAVNIGIFPTFDEISVFAFAFDFQCIAVR